jgi:tRNA-dihydrouridine synthase A
MTDTEKFRFCVAPMLDWTDRHCRYFMRLMTKRARLYTEMVTAPAILFGNRDLLLKFDETEHPIACQLGGSDPEDLAKPLRRNTVTTKSTSTAAAPPSASRKARLAPA